MPPRHRHCCLLLALGVASAAPSSGCTQDTSAQLRGALEDRVKERVKERVKDSKAASPSPTGTQPELLGNKLGLYLECGRLSEAPARASYRAYREVVPLDGGALGVIRGLLPSIEAAAREACKVAVKTGRHLQPPQPELEAAAAAYGEALEIYAERLDEAAALLGSGAVGKRPDPAVVTTIRELDPSLGDAYAAWEDASGDFTEAINHTQAALDALVLARIEAHAGRTSEYHVRAFIIASRPLVRCLAANPGVACESAFFALEQAHGELHGYLGRHPDEAGRVFWLDHFLSAADRYYEAARGLMGKVRGDTMSKEAIDAVIGEFNDLLREAENLNFKRVSAG